MPFATLVFQQNLTVILSQIQKGLRMKMMKMIKIKMNQIQTLREKNLC